MARETKAQREAREEAERQAYETEMAATYPQRLMSMLERAQRVNYELRVVNGTFEVEDLDDRSDRRVTLTLDYSLSNQEGLHELDWRVDMKEAAEREAERRYQLRSQALAKLSQEELEALGL